MIEKFINKESLDYIEIGISITFLINLLHSHYGKKVMILVDDYDRHLMNLAAADENLYKEAFDLTNQLLSPIKYRAKYLQFSIVTGISKVIFGNIFGGFNTLLNYSLIDSTFSDFFGFTEPEVDDLIKRALEFKPGLKKNNIKKIATDMCYSHSIQKKKLYNSISIINCLQKLCNNEKNCLSNHWASSGSVKFIEFALKKSDSIYKVEYLLRKKSMNFTYKRSSQFDQIKENTDDFLSFLIYSGYLSYVNEKKLQIPNKSVMSYFYNHLLLLYHENFGLSFPDVMSSNIEDCNAYKQILQENIFDKIDDNSIKEIDFKFLIILPFLNPNDLEKKYVYKIEKKIHQNENISFLLQPVKGKSESVMVFKLEENKNDLMGKRFFDLFEGKTVDFLLEQTSKKTKKHWNKFYLRVARYSYENEKWILSMDELVFEKEGLRQAILAFGKDSPECSKIIDFLKAFEAK